MKFLAMHQCSKTFEATVAPGAYVARAVESKLYSPEGTYLKTDDRFEVEGGRVKARYRINERHYPIPGGPLTGTVIVTEYLIVAEGPFIVHTAGMCTDEDYGTDEATVVRIRSSEATLVGETTKITDIDPALFEGEGLLNP